MRSYTLTFSTAVANIVLAIVALTFVNSTIVFLLGICANVCMTFFSIHHYWQYVNC